MPIRVLIVDDQAIARSGLKIFIDASKNFEVVAEASDGAEALASAAEHRPDIVVMDLNMPHVDGVNATYQLMRLPNPPRVLILSASDDYARAMDALKAGACGYLLKDASHAELLAALKAVMTGCRVIAPDLLARLINRPPMRMNALTEKLATLTEGEVRVLSLLGIGMTNAQIARGLHLSLASVKTYVSRTLGKLGLENRTQAAIIAHETGITSLVSSAGEGIVSRVADAQRVYDMGRAGVTRDRVPAWPLPTGTSR
ncbi:response regulator transcription factor [Streptomyces klenkii]|uniref:response regulator transcription factor n=1 Tax=Streptomyces klenkii TaxID=1420899 RepID=UPI003437F95B